MPNRGRKPDLVGVSEIADRLGWQRSKVGTYIKRGLFPEPIMRLKMGPIWRWADIKAVAIDRGWITSSDWNG